MVILQPLTFLQVLSKTFRYAAGWVDPSRAGGMLGDGQFGMRVPWQTKPLGGCEQNTRPKYPDPRQRGEQKAKQTTRIPFGFPKW